MPKWRVEFSPKSDKQLQKLDLAVQKKMIDSLRRVLSDYPSPRATGSALTRPYKRFWRYRVGEYRVVCEIQDQKLIVWVVGIAHRRDVYRT